MGLPSFNTDDRILSMLQSQWASQIDPVIGLPLVKGTTLKNVKLVTGDNTINHLLQRPIQGYLVTNMQGAFSQIFSKPSAMPDLTMILNSSANTTVTLYVF